MKIITAATRIAEENNVPFYVADAYVNYLDKAAKKLRLGGRTTYHDSTRQKTYNAENKFMREHGRGISFATVEEAQKFADKVFASKVWENHKTNRVSPNSPKIEYSNKLTRFSGVAYSNRIVLGRSGMNAYILLHELAHTNGHRHHDFSFRSCLIDLVTKFMGKEHGDALKKTFKEDGLKLSVRNVSEVKPFAEWYKTYERMEKARACRSA